MPQDTLWLDSARTTYLLQTSTGHDVYQGGTVKNDFQRKSEMYASWALPCSILLMVGLWLLVRLVNGRSKGFVEIGSGAPNDYENYSEDSSSSAENIDYLSYNGRDLDFAKPELAAILLRRSPYYAGLNPFDKDRFIVRLKKFMLLKNFRIHDKSGFKEMPILVSAAAVQVSFGLENYLLPDFHTINIFPEEFLGVSPNMRFLEGNVSGDTINLSWKHFLEGFEFSDNGENVGLHEMAHAYYYQNILCRNCEDKVFRKTYPLFEEQGNVAFTKEAEPGNDFYSSYALKNFQEFWAESVEIFFEKPALLKRYYPSLYTAISELLNQDPARGHP